MIILWFALSAGLLGWIGLFLWLTYNAPGYRTVSAASPFPLQDSPSVTIIIPARNEAKILATTLPAILKQDYSNYEVILVDDASEDGTSELVKGIAARLSSPLRVIRVDELPSGWVGKTHALHLGFEAAQSEWVLATDADIVFHPKALKAGLWLAQQNRADLVSIYAYLDCVSFWEKALLPGFGLLLSAFFPMRKINDPADSMALASGGYILMRRNAWAGLGGYAAIRSEMIDDLNTARRMKRSGRRIYVTATRNLLSTRMYDSFKRLWEGLRKNAFAGHGFSVHKMLGTITAYFVGNLLPVLCLIYFVPKWSGGGATVHAVVLLSAVQYAINVAMHVPVLRYLRINLLYALLAPVGGVVYGAICTDSLVRTLFGRGVSWKLRQYGKPRPEIEA